MADEPEYVSATRSHPSERRDVRRVIEHWLRNTWATDSIPLLDTFDFSPMRGDWGQRFLICGGDAVNENSCAGPLQRGGAVPPISERSPE